MARPRRSARASRGRVLSGSVLRVRRPCGQGLPFPDRRGRPRMLRHGCPDPARVPGISGDPRPSVGHALSRRSGRDDRRPAVAPRGVDARIALACATPHRRRSDGGFMAVALTANAYERALASIEAVSWRGISLGLERTEALLAALGNPHIGLRGALVAGTNGKGSVCAVVDSVARAAGLHTVLLTKPHLTSYRERIVIDGEPIDEEQFVTLVDDVERAAGTLPESLQPTGFEMLTAAGILCAARESVDLLVCEVGMGGRLDSTNVLDLGVAVVTNVALDHREHLGETIPAIAFEKAAIIKHGNDAVTAAQEPALGVISARCAEVGARLLNVSQRGAVTGIDHVLAGVEVTASFAGKELQVRAPLVGRFQMTNLATGIAVCDALRERGARIDAAAIV